MNYIEKLDLQTNEVGEVENLEKHTIINNKPFTVDEYIGHDRDFLAIDGNYNDGFNQLNKINGISISCIVSKEVNNLSNDVNRIDSDINELSSDINNRIDNVVNEHSSDVNRIDNVLNELSSDINRIDSDINVLSSDINNRIDNVVNEHSSDVNRIDSDINRIDSDINELSKTRNISSVNLLNTFRDEDCILITTIDGITILIDCGEETSQEKILENIDNLGIEKLDYFIITHFHSDHAGNTSAIIDNYQPTNIYYKEVVWEQLPSKEIEWKTKEYFDKFISACQRNNILPNKVTTDITIPISRKETIKILNASFTNYNDYNSGSLMVQYNNGKTYCLFAGDVTTEVLETYKNSIPKLSLYKCAHHGGYPWNVSESFMLKAKPRICHINGDDMQYSRETSEMAKYCCNSDVYVCGEYDRGAFGYIITDIGAYPSHNLKKINFNEYIFEYNNNWYACDNAGNLVQNGIVDFKGSLCFIKDWKMVTIPSWVKYGGQDYYIDYTGYLLCNGWKQSDDPNTPHCWFYLGSNGRMIKNTQKVIGTKLFTFDNSGIASPSPIE